MAKRWALLGTALFLLILVAAIAAYFAHYLAATDAQILIYGLTAIAVVLYTLVNWLLVQETQALRITQIRPYVLINYDMASGRFQLTNAGNGAAVNIRLERIYSTDQEPGEGLDTNLRSVPDEVAVLRRDDTIPLGFKLYVGDEVMETLADDYTAALKPDRPPFGARADFEVQGSYQDIDGRPYRFRIRTGKAGFRILEQ